MPADPSKSHKSKNTAVYVTSLPQDTEVDELVQRFGKCGVIEEDDEGEPKIKMYAREDGSFSGEALVVFFKEDSVTLALNLMDEAELRLGDSSTRMRVQKAEFGHKQQQGPEGHAGGERKVVSKKKATKRIGKMQRCVARMVCRENGPHGDTQEIGGLGFGGRIRSHAHSDGQVQQPGEQKRSDRRPEAHVHPRGVGGRPFVALGSQRGREGGMCDVGGCHERRVVRCEKALYFGFLVYCSPFHSFVRLCSKSQRAS